MEIGTLVSNNSTGQSVKFQVRWPSIDPQFSDVSIVINITNSLTDFEVFGECIFKFK